MKSPSFKELQSYSMDDLVKLYDQESTNTYVGIGFILDEISRRKRAEEDKRSLTIAKLSLLISTLSTIIAIISLFNK